MHKFTLINEIHVFLGVHIYQPSSQSVLATGIVASYISAPQSASQEDVVQTITCPNSRKENSVSLVQSVKRASIP